MEFRQPQTLTPTPDSKPLRGYAVVAMVVIGEEAGVRGDECLVVAARGADPTARVTCMRFDSCTALHLTACGHFRTDSSVSRKHFLPF